EINSSGGIAGRLIKLHLADDKNEVEEGKKTAQVFSENIDIVAAIGHRAPVVGQVSSLIYEYTNIVMIAPGITSSALNRVGFRRVFRSLPSEAETGHFLAQRLADAGYNKVLLVYQNDDVGRSFSNAFESKAEDLRLRIVMRLAYDIGAERSFERAVKSLEESDIDAVVMGLHGEETLQTVSILHENGVEKPTYVSQEAERLSVLSKLKKIKDLRIASIYDSESSSELMKSFVASYSEAHGVSPSVWAAQGYESLMTLKAAIQQAGSTSPKKISDALRDLKDYEGIFGPQSFDQHGQIKNVQLIMKRLDGKKLVREADKQ
ncbi:MAG: ABC transporter substrate-binding protein, partial [Myxococcota bacterium]|nr:ABC transporter substrate-binding protein [Myxococcota bacterium]